MRVLRVLVAALLAVTVAAGCGSAPESGSTAGGAGSTPFPGGVPVGSSAHAIDVAGRTRTFRVYRPVSLRPGPAPLVVMIHGGGGTARGAEQRYGWDGVADREGVVVAYPDGLARSWNGGGGCCGASGRDGVDDVGFVTGMIAALGAALPIDRARTYVTGISEGGLMSYRLACDTRLFAAIGPDSATRTGPCPGPAPTSVIHIHGDADQRIPLDGHPGAGVNHIAGWAARDRCPPATTTVAGAVTTTTSEPCAGGRAVTLIVVAGAGHQWPGAPRGAGDPPSTALSATEVFWRFFAAHPAPA